MNTHDFSENLIDYKIINIDKRYRELFKDYIIESKKLTHNCQFNCYNNKNVDLKESENCSRNCFLPMIHIKKNISKLIENCKENFEKCKQNANLEKSNRSKIDKCLENYEKDLMLNKEEAEYIYSGYLKNLNELMKNQKK